MPREADVIAADRNFFAALITPNPSALDSLLTQDFLLIDLQGSELDKAGLLAMVTSQQVRFESIEPIEHRVRFYGETAIITGRTQMKIRAGAAEFDFSSRYTHVYVMQTEQWRMASAQGTPIA